MTKITTGEAIAAGAEPPRELEHMDAAEFIKLITGYEATSTQREILAALERMTNSPMVVVPRSHVPRFKAPQLRLCDCCGSTFQVYGPTDFNVTCDGCLDEQR